jgi:hypothetical protein
MAKKKIISNEELLKEIKSLKKEIDGLKKLTVIQFIPQPYPVYSPCTLLHYPYVQPTISPLLQPYQILCSNTVGGAAIYG